MIRLHRKPSAGSARVALAAVLAAFLAVAVTLAVSPTANADASIEIAAAGDIGCPPGGEPLPEDGVTNPDQLPKQWRCRGDEVATMIAAEDPMFTIAAGDLVQGPNASRNAYDEFDRTWDAIRGRIMPTPGNHDIYRSGAGPRDFDGYYAYWEEQGASSSRIGQRDRSWASYDIGSWHLVDLNSNCRVVDCTLTGPQVQWLLRDLKRDRGNPETGCILAYMHHPLFSAGMPLGRTGDHMLVSNLWEVLYRYGADIVVTGHQHYYERYRPLNPSGRPDPGGIRQYVTGTGGSFLFSGGKRDLSAPVAESTLYGFGATFFELGPSAYRSRFRTVRGRDLDQLATPVECHRPSEGRRLRRLRTRRFRQRVGILRRLSRTESRLVRRVRTLREQSDRSARGAHRPGPKPARTSDTGPRIKSLITRLERARRIRERLLDRPLYPRVRPRR